MGVDEHTAGKGVIKAEEEGYDGGFTWGWGEGGGGEKEGGVRATVEERNGEEDVESVLYFYLYRERKRGMNRLEGEGSEKQEDMATLPGCDERGGGRGRGCRRVAYSSSSG